MSTGIANFLCQLRQVEISCQPPDRLFGLDGIRFLQTAWANVWATSVVIKIEQTFLMWPGFDGRGDTGGGSRGREHDADAADERAHLPAAGAVPSRPLPDLQRGCRRLRPRRGLHHRLSQVRQPLLHRRLS